MTNEEYISSGILETYALGAATPAEKLDVENMLSSSEEIRKALDLIQKDLEVYLTLHAIEPDERLKEKVLDAVKKDQASNPSIENGKIISLVKESNSTRLKNYAIAASLILVVSIAINFSQWRNGNSLKAEKLQQDTILSAEKTQKMFFASMMVSSQEKLDSAMEELKFIRNPMTQNIALNSMVKGHPMKATIYWDMKSMQVAVDPLTLPATASDEKYVLWAVIDGKAVNEGNFEMNANTGMLMMKVIPEAEAFAISLEKSGDIPVAEGPIYVMGKPSPTAP